MNLVLKTKDNKYKINFDGIAIVYPNKDGLTKDRTIAGRLKLRWRSEHNAISITFNYLPSKDYETLLNIWSQSSQEVILTSDRGVYQGILIDERIQLNSQRDSKGNIFYNGTINMEE